MTTKTNEKLVSSVLGMRTVEFTHICVRVVFSSFTNPLTSELQHILMNVTAVPSYTPSEVPIIPKISKVGSRDSSVESSSVRADAAPVVSEPDTDLNNDTAKALIMSILGPDGGLGGSVDGASLPWIFGNMQ